MAEKMMTAKTSLLPDTMLTKYSSDVQKMAIDMEYPDFHLVVHAVYGSLLPEGVCYCTLNFPSGKIKFIIKVSFPLKSNFTQWDFQWRFLRKARSSVALPVLNYTPVSITSS